MTSSRIARAALLAGAIAAALDISGAMALTAAHGRPAVNAIKAIAVGALGPSAYRGGAEIVLLGLAIHLAIATAMATAYMVVAARQPWMTRRPWLWGPIYGLLMWAIMYLIVLPLRWPELYPSFAPDKLAGQLACHLLLVGTPIALVASRMLGHAR